MNPIEYTFGHCPNQNQPGGCQLHNIQCGYPVCDRRPVVSSKRARLTAADAARLRQEAVTSKQASLEADANHILDEILTIIEETAKRGGSKLNLDEFSIMNYRDGSPNPVDKIVLDALRALDYELEVQKLDSHLVSYIWVIW